jgi:phage terminase small subunit
MLTAKQEEFVQGIIKGLSQADAYRAAYSSKNMSDKTIHEAASRLMSDSKIATRIKELREQISSKNIMTAQERLEFLTGVINGTRGEKIVEVIDGEAKEIEVPASMKNRLSAIDIMNKMTGEYVQKVVADVDTSFNINIELSDD